MGRHRRSDAGRAATSRAAGVTHHDGSYGEGLDPRGAGADGPPTMGTAPYLNPEAYAETYARSEAYLYATDGTAVPSGGAGFPRGRPPGRRPRPGRVRLHRVRRPHRVRPHHGHRRRPRRPGPAHRRVRLHGPLLRR